MPSVQLYGRRWHFSTDIVAVPAALSGLFHASWILILLVWAGAKGAWPGRCASGDGVQYAVVLGGLLGSFAANLVLDALLVWHSLQGAPFEASKRRWVVPLLYAATAPLVAQLAFAAYGSHVSTQLTPDCWPDDQRNAVTNLTQAVVFATWGFMFVAALGIAITYNMYPQHHDLNSWEARCECIASMLCCHHNMVRRPDGKRPPLQNIAELTAGLLSHCDLDASDITAALFLAAAAQNRRRRLRVAKALLPVYQALRSATGSTADERSFAEVDDEDRHSDASSEASSINDVPADPELDRWLALQRSHSLRRQQQLQHAIMPQPPLATGSLPAESGNQQQQQQQLKRGKAVAWAADVRGAAEYGGSSPAAAPTFQPPAPEPSAFNPTGSRPASDVEHAASLPLTQDNVVVLEQQLGAAPGGDSSPRANQVQQAAEMVAGELLSELPEEMPEEAADVLDQLASAIQSEIQELGGQQAVPADAVLEMAKEDSLDLSTLEVDPEAPSIWFSAQGSRQSGRQSSSRSMGSAAPHGHATQGDQLAAKSPFHTEGGASVSDDDSSKLSAEEASEPTEGVMHAVAVEAAAAIATTSAVPGLGKHARKAGQPPGSAAREHAPLGLQHAAQTDGGGSPPLPQPHAPAPPADDVAAAAVATAAAAAAGSSPSPRSVAQESGVGSGAGTFGLERQISVRFPVVITPSEHVEDFRGALPASALADIYAGRHDKVPLLVLKEATHFLKFSYAVYSLQPKFDNPSSGLDVACCMACRSPRDPQQVVFKGLGELEQLDDDSSVELLHLNCSNRVLSHLPYMIALDHSRQAVVLAIRGTISAADLVTDAVVHPEPLDDWLPDSIKRELEEPAFAHAGMMSAAKAIFEDMTERGILQQLVSDEEVGDFMAPEEQRAQRGGAGMASSTGSQYDADAGSGAASAERYSLGGKKGQHGNGQHGNGRGGRAGDSNGGHVGPGSGGGGEPSGYQAQGRQLGELMRHKVQEEGWQFVVEGHSLGAGAAALISLKLLQTFPGLKCIAYCCPGGLVSKNLSHAMARFTTTVAVGKDAVPRSTVGNLMRMMDEMVTALARCRQPKLKVLFLPWWRRGRHRFRDLFYSYDAMPAEAREMLQQYYESRNSMGQPLSMYPPGRVLFLRPIKTRQAKEWDAVWVQPEDLIAEGLLISPHMLRDHLCSTSFSALLVAASRAERLDGSESELAGQAEARQRVAAAAAVPARRVPRRAARERLRQRMDAQRAGSLQQVLIEAS